jgi:hypothetical protein
MEKTYVVGSREFRLWLYRGYWYAVWRDPAGKKRKKTLKTKRRDVAEARIPELAEQLDAETRPTFGQYVDRLLEEGDEYLSQRGLTEQTVYAKKRCIEILKKQFGSDVLGETREANIEKWLRMGKYAPSYQGEIMDAYKFVMRQAKRDRFDVQIPEFYRPDRKVTRRSSLEPEEVRALFPDSIEKISALYEEDEDGHGVMFGLLYRTILHAGLRPGEGRAIGRHQLYLDDGVLVVSRRLGRHNEVLELKKRKYGDSDVFRLVPLPDRTVELLRWWIETTEPQDFLFLYHGEPVRQRYISERWAKALTRVRIGPEKKPFELAGRKIDVQALRVTYRSMTEGWLPRAFLLGAMGHRSADVHDGYLRHLERQVQAVGKHRGETNEAWTLDHGKATRVDRTKNSRDQTGPSPRIEDGGGEAHEQVHGAAFRGEG